ncbi:Protein of unknown function [Solimonas aquatica]|uniref:Outer membrane lipoprotein-sorting protein n=1 Tax=Solimonas aquatica TaxID=489703 RepID=A0A1H9CXG0_9GAMM|nr:Protein of unknown function [Solimonas aquatica]
MIRRGGDSGAARSHRRRAAASFLSLITLAALLGGASVAAQAPAAAGPQAETSAPPQAEPDVDALPDEEQTPPPSAEPPKPVPLTVYGAQATGNDAGSIPAWSGGLSAPPSCWRGAGSRYCDPYPEDQPLYVVTADNLAQYAALLSPGQRALFAAYPKSWRMRVFATRRSFANPARIYAATEQNAGKAVLDGDVLSKAGEGVPFPQPANGAEVISNHRLRYRPLYSERQAAQFAVEANGDYLQVAVRELQRFAYGAPAYALDKAKGMLSQLAQIIEAPTRLAGSAMLIADMAQPQEMARNSWQRSPDEGSMRRAPNLAYDTPGQASMSLRSNDQIDSFFGPTDYYDFKLRGKQELLVPANSYALHDGKLSYHDIVGAHHLNPELLRYELRRVWVVDATVRRGLSHSYRHRRFYVDEDGWQIRIVDNSDEHGELWRLQEAHTLMAYDQLYEMPAALTVYDLRDRRYLVEALNNQEPEVRYPDLEPGDFKPSAISRRSRELQK